MQDQANRRAQQYDLTITNVTSFGPDGVSKPAMLINGGFPGPTIVAGTN
jgi:hypothetical protein